MFFVNQNWPQMLEMLFRVLFAALLAGLIGYEREYVHRNAGLRTHILVAIGASLVMCCGEYLVDRGVFNSLDPTRLGAQVVSGIGFLCAGTILKEGRSVRGLTTASSLWCVSCIGLACGCGNYILAAAVTASVYITLKLLRNLAHRRRELSCRIALQLTMSATCDLTAIFDILLVEYGCHLDDCALSTETQPMRRKAALGLTLRTRPDLPQILQRLSSIEGIQSINSICET